MKQRHVWLILALTALALRLPDIGNPLIDYDEQMYLLVGRRMWAGALPYVDIWDRKPIGLFLLYAGSQAFGGDPILAYHLLALVAVIVTAGLIALLVGRLGGERGGVYAGLLYLVWIELIGGRGGQSPIFYNALIVAAAHGVWANLCTGRRWPAYAAMLLAGLALQIKPTAVFEGCGFGAMLLVAEWWRRRDAVALMRLAAALVGIAIVPTMLAFAVYAWLGHGDAWWFANVRSIFLRTAGPGTAMADRVSGMAIVLLVPLGVAIAGVAGRASPQRSFAGGWLVIAILGWLAVPPYYNHYALPLLVPIATCAGLAMDRRPSTRLLVGIAGAILLLMLGFPSNRMATEEARRHVAASAALINRYRGSRCLFIYQGPVALYNATNSCLPSRYPFPEHLAEASERYATGIDPHRETRRILAARPPVIVDKDPEGVLDPATRALVLATLRRHYRLLERTPGYRLYVRVD